MVLQQAVLQPWSLVDPPSVLYLHMHALLQLYPIKFPPGFAALECREREEAAPVDLDWWPALDERGAIMAALRPASRWLPCCLLG